MTEYKTRFKIGDFVSFTYSEYEDSIPCITCGAKKPKYKSSVYSGPVAGVWVEHDKDGVKVSYTIKTDHPDVRTHQVCEESGYNQHMFLTEHEAQVCADRLNKEKQ